MKCYKHNQKEAKFLWTEGKQYLALCKDCVKELPNGKERNLNNTLLEISLLSDEGFNKIEKLILQG